MKKLKENTKIILGMVIGLILSTASYVLADSIIDSKNVYYKDNSGLAVNNVQDAIDGTCTKFDNNLANLKKEIINEMYPVGSIYISTTLSTTAQVKSALGGEWQAYGNDKVLRGTTSKAEVTGGNDTVTLAVDNLPSHSHTIPALSGSTGGAGKHSHTVTTTASKTTGNGVTNASGWLYWGGTSGYVAGTHDIVAGHSGYSQNYASGSTTVPGMGLNNYHNIPALSGSTNEVADHTHPVSTTASNTGATGGGKSISVQDAYITVYMYKRTK